MCSPLLYLHFRYNLYNLYNLYNINKTEIVLSWLSNRTEFISFLIDPLSTLFALMDNLPWSGIMVYPLSFSLSTFKLYNRIFRIRKVYQRLSLKKLSPLSKRALSDSCSHDLMDALLLCKGHRTHLHTHPLYTIKVLTYWRTQDAGRVALSTSKFYSVSPLLFPLHPSWFQSQY